MRSDSQIPLPQLEQQQASQYVEREAQKLVAARRVWHYATVTTFAVIIIAERVG